MTPLRQRMLEDMAYPQPRREHPIGLPATGYLPMHDTLTARQKNWVRRRFAPIRSI